MPRSTPPPSPSGITFITHISPLVRLPWRMRWWLFTGFALAIVAVATWFLLAHRGQQSIPVGGGTELRILHVSVGTNHTYSAEPIWKQTLRRVLPESLEANLSAAVGDTVSSRYSTLVVWLRAEPSPPPGPPMIATPTAWLHKTNAFSGRVSQINSNTFRLQFTVFARDQREIPLQLRYSGAEIVRFNVQNPDPLSQVIGPAMPVPQTNDYGHTKIILRRLTPRSRGTADYGLNFGTIVPSGAGWIQWHYYVFGDDGNWMQSRSSSEGMTTRLSPSGRFQVIAEGTEYISAGYVERPGDGASLSLPANDRAKIFGLRHLTFLGAGTFTIKSGLIISAQAYNSNAPSLSFRSFGSNWTATVQVAAPSLFSLNEVESGQPAPKVRIRERLEDGRGRIFAPQATVSSTNVTGKVKRIATLLTPRFPAVTTNLEVEVMVNFPPAEFHVRIPD